MRAAFEPTTPHSDSIARPNCSQCGTATLLIGIEAQRSGRELHTFQCPNCEHFETSVGKSARPRPHRKKRARSITPFVRSEAFGPEQIEMIDEVFRQACQTLGLAERGDRLGELVAKRVIELAQTGVRTRSALYFLTIADFKSNPQ